MPLLKGKNRAAIGKNIETEMAHGEPRKQAIAIALDVARRSGANIPKKKKRFARAVGKSLRRKG